MAALVPVELPAKLLHRRRLFPDHLLMILVFVPGPAAPLLQYFKRSVP